MINFDFEFLISITIVFQIPPVLRRRPRVVLHNDLLLYRRKLHGNRRSAVLSQRKNPDDNGVVEHSDGDSAGESVRFIGPSAARYSQVHCKFHPFLPHFLLNFPFRKSTTPNSRQLISRESSISDGRLMMFER